MQRRNTLSCRPPLQMLTVSIWSVSYPYTHAISSTLPPILLPDSQVNSGESPIKRVLTSLPLFTRAFRERMAEIALSCVTNTASRFPFPFFNCSRCHPHLFFSISDKKHSMFVNCFLRCDLSLKYYISNEVPPITIDAI